MTANETIVFDHITSQAGKEGKWAVSLNALAGTTELSKDEVTAALKGLEAGGHIDQFPLSMAPEEIVGLQVVSKK